MNSLHILHLNVNGLRTRLIELQLYLETLDPPADILMLNETKLKHTKPPRIINFTVVAARSRTLSKLQGGGSGNIRPIYPRRLRHFTRS